MRLLGVGKIAAISICGPTSRYLYAPTFWPLGQSGRAGTPETLHTCFSEKLAPLGDRIIRLLIDAHALSTSSG